MERPEGLTAVLLLSNDSHYHLTNTLGNRTSTA